MRISHLRSIFQREYDERWTLEYSIVGERGIKQGIPFYRLQDLEGDDIKGKFYANEISKILIDKTTSFRIEKNNATYKKQGPGQVDGLACQI